ncbi:trans-1,2-dihydrobenzene-1,2-diol dehydrogenase-like isoform X2 [Danaus plexippus]|uniref:trans-1,2-dihydrobenzene-1,2-diol dehydrogenase-like isoform X2 n=1 Tax=Danaus plexippus TaxID=13037 RepID=UPI002AAF64D3|nr:trans-1,2-dihydrobenzene-1,2-diol dehydrogenase-like isoform X2 [Danaus plexippus]
METGSVGDAKHTGRPKTSRSNVNIEAVRESVADNPGTPIRRRGQELQISRTSLQRILTKDLCLHAYKYISHFTMTVRWGIVTAGKISHDFVNAVNSYPEKGDQVIAAVAARDPTRAKEFAKTHNIPKVFNTYEDMAISNDIDVAYIGALNHDHYALSKLFLESGKHVLCEKPFCLNAKQVESLVKIAKNQNLFLMEALWSRFAPFYVNLEEQLESGIIGRPQFVEVNFGLPIENVERLRKKDLGGGALMDIGIYTVHFAQLVFKEDPIKITAVGELNDDGVDSVETVILEYSEGRRAVLNNHAKVKLWNKATVVGDYGKRITFEDPFNMPDTMIHADGRVEKFEFHPSKIPYNFMNSAGLVYEALETVRCIKEGLKESPIMSHSRSLQLIKILDTVRKQLGVHYDVDDQGF